MAGRGGRLGGVHVAARPRGARRRGQPARFAGDGADVRADEHRDAAARARALQPRAADRLPAAALVTYY